MGAPIRRGDSKIWETIIFRFIPGGWREHPVGEEVFWVTFASPSFSKAPKKTGKMGERMQPFWVFGSLEFQTKKQNIHRMSPHCEKPWNTEVQWYSMFHTPKKTYCWWKGSGDHHLGCIKTIKTFYSKWWDKLLYLSAKALFHQPVQSHRTTRFFFRWIFRCKSLLRFQGVASRSWSPACVHGGQVGRGNLECSTWRLGFSCIELEHRYPQTLQGLSTFIRAVRVYMGNKKQHQISRGRFAVWVFQGRKNPKILPSEVSKEKTNNNKDPNRSVLVGIKFLLHLVWLVVEPTPLKNLLVILGSSSSIFGVKIKNVWNHHLVVIPNISGFFGLKSKLYYINWLEPLIGIKCLVWFFVQKKKSTYYK